MRERGAMMEHKQAVLCNREEYIRVVRKTCKTVYLLSHSITLCQSSKIIDDPAVCVVVVHQQMKRDLSSFSDQRHSITVRGQWHSWPAARCSIQQSIKELSVFKHRLMYWHVRLMVEALKDCRARGEIVKRNLWRIKWHPVTRMWRTYCRRDARSISRFFVYKASDSDRMCLEWYLFILLIEIMFYFNVFPKENLTFIDLSDH